MVYSFKFKSRYWPFWKTIKVVGHHYDKQTDRIDLFLANNKGIYSVGNWSSYKLLLGKDWMEAQKAAMEEETGQPIPMKRNL
jgi:hypothetical protein